MGKFYCSIYQIHDASAFFYLLCPGRAASNNRDRLPLGLQRNFGWYKSDRKGQHCNTYIGEICSWNIIYDAGIISSRLDIILDKYPYADIYLTTAGKWLI